MQTTIEKPSSVEDALDSAKRRQVLDGARQVFLAHGFDAASMGEIAKAAGVQPSVARELIRRRRSEHAAEGAVASS